MIAYIKKPKTLKRIIALVLAVCMIFALSACKDNGTDKTPAGNNSAGSSLTDSQVGGSGDSNWDGSLDSNWDGSSDSNGDGSLDSNWGGSLDSNTGSSADSNTENIGDSNIGNTGDSNTGNAGNTGDSNNGNNGDSNTGNTGNTGNSNTENIGDSNTGNAGNTGDSNTGNNGDSNTGNAGNTGNSNTGNNGDSNTGNTGNTGDSNTGNNGDSNTGNTGNTGDSNTGNNGDSNTGNTGNAGDSSTENNGDSNTGNAGNTGDSNTGNNGDSNTGNTGNTGDSNTGNTGDANTGNNGDSNTGNPGDTQGNGGTNGSVGHWYNVTEEVIEARSDYDEVKPDESEANGYAPLKGYKDAEANAMKENILNTENTEVYYADRMTGTKYYLSPGGNDDNDGLTPETALRTTDALTSLDLNPGDSILFERNSIFRITSQINLREGVIYGSYGEGTKPQIYGSPYNYAGGDYWEPTPVKNVWKATYLYEEISCVVYNHGELVGNLRWDPVKLRENGDFYNANNDDAIYIYCDKGNPAKVFESIEVSPMRYVFKGSRINNYVVDNICIKYAGAFGVSSYGPNKNIYITNCEMGYIGGFSRNKSLRLGNAIEFGAGADHYVVDNNWIYQTFDTAITWQNTGFTTYKNITFSNNLLEYNVCDIEFFNTGGADVDNFKVEGNLCRFTAAGWGNRPSDAGFRGIEGFIRATTSPLNISNWSFKNNIIDCPARYVYNWFNNYKQNDQMEFSGNEYYIKQSYRTGITLIHDFAFDEKGGQGDAYNATTAEETKKIINMIDPTGKVYWFE